MIELASAIENKAVKFAPLAKAQQGGIAFLIGRLYTLALVIAGLAFFAYLIIGGIRWLLSGGDKAALDAARNTIVNALVGLVIVVGAYAITKIVEVTLGLKILQ